MPIYSLYNFCKVYKVDKWIDGHYFLEYPFTKKIKIY